MTTAVFDFGGNWKGFLEHVSEDRIRVAEASLREGLDLATLADRSFLDMGSGSGLFSLAARRLGARVYSIDVGHTGGLAKAMANAARPVAPGGVLFIAIYNDQGWVSVFSRTGSKTKEGAAV